MAKAGNLVSPVSFNSLFSAAKLNNNLRFLAHLHTSSNVNAVTASASTKRKHNLHSQLIGKNTSRVARRLITISPGDGKYQGNWTSDYLVSLQDLQLRDLIEDDDDPHKDAQVFINLTIQKHASFGLSVDGRVVTSFTRKCSNCSSPYCRQIDTTFNVWVLIASRDNRKVQLPEIGGDPSVIYARPGYEVDLDHLVQDTLRLNSLVKDTCSEVCEKSEATIQYTSGQSQTTFDKRWSRLLELKKKLL